MELETINKEKQLLEFRIKGSRHTLAQLLRAELINDANVEFVSYKLVHPLDKDCIFIIKTKGENPKKILQKCCEKLEKKLKDFNSQVKDVL